MLSVSWRGEELSASIISILFMRPYPPYHLNLLSSINKLLPTSSPFLHHPIANTYRRPFMQGFCSVSQLLLGLKLKFRHKKNRNIPIVTFQKAERKNIKLWFWLNLRDTLKVARRTISNDQASGQSFRISVNAKSVGSPFSWYDLKLGFT